MSIERQPQVRIAQQKTIENARQQALRDINTRLVNLDSAIAGLRDVGTWGDVQSIDSSDSTRVSAVRTGGAAAGGYSIGVTRLARAQQMLQGTAASAASADDTLTIQVGAGTAVDVSLTAGDSLRPWRTRSTARAAWASTPRSSTPSWCCPAGRRAPRTRSR